MIKSEKNYNRVAHYYYIDTNTSRVRTCIMLNYDEISQLRKEKRF